MPDDGPAWRSNTLKDGRGVQLPTSQPDPIRQFEGAVLHNRIKSVRTVKRAQMCHRIGENFIQEIASYAVLRKVISNRRSLKGQSRLFEEMPIKQNTFRHFPNNFMFLGNLRNLQNSTVFYRLFFRFLEVASRPIWASRGTHYMGFPRKLSF